LNTKTLSSLSWRHSLTFACLASLGATTFAQNGVVIYGMLNPGITSVSNVSSNRDLIMSEGVIQPSRLGFKGTEDLGNGWTSVFQLESGINVKNGTLGQGGVLFGRQAYVGFSSKDAGTLTLGRQYSFMYDDFIWMTNGVVTYNVYAFKMGDSDGTAAQRMNNSIKYVSANYGGFQVGVMHSLGENPESAGKQSSDSASLTYTGSKVRLAAALSRVRDSKPALSIGTKVFAVDVNQTTFDKITSAAVGGQTLVGNNDLHVIVSSVTYELGSRSARLKMFEIGAARPVAAKLNAAVGYNYYRFDGVHFNQVSVGLDYVLSKRSDLSISYGGVQGSAGTHPQLYLAPGASSTRTQQVVSIGMRHRF
jgi:outer membrane protein OmpU